MSTIIAGVVKNGVVVPQAPLPEGAQVEIRLNGGPADVPLDRKDELPAQQQASGCTGGIPAVGEPVAAARLTPGELRRMPREQRQAILAAAAAWAEQDYRSDKELTGFEAFSEEELDDDESDAR
jgi:hypothetical protein